MKELSLNDVREATAWSDLPAREIAPEDWERFRVHVAEIFEALGMDLDTPGTRETPERFLRALYDATAGYEGDPKLLTAFPAESDGEAAAAGMIVEGRSRSAASASTTRCRSSVSHTSVTSPARRSSASRS